MLGPCLRRAYLPALPSRGRCRFLLCHFPVTEPHFSHGTSLRKRCLSLSRFCSSVVVKDNPCPIRWSHVGVSPHSVVIATFGRGVWSTTVSPFGCNFWNWIIPPPPCQPFVYPHLGIVRSKCSEVCCLPYMLLFCSIFSLRTCSWSIKLTWLPLKGVCWAIDCVVQLNGHSFGKKWSFHQFAMHQRRGIHTSFLTTLRVACLEINGTLLFVKEAYLQNITTLLNFHSRDA